jgi:hypothetical protein
MAHHVFAAGLVAVLSIGALSISHEAAARSGGLGGPGAGRGFGGHVGFSRPHLRPVGRPFVNGRHFRPHTRPFIGNRFPHRKAFGNKRDIGLGLPLTAVGGYVDGTNYAYPYPVPVDAGPVTSGGPVVPYRHVCRSEVQVVPATAGGEASITVTSCYVVPDVR